MGRKTFLIAALAIFVILAFIIPNNEYEGVLDNPITYDSTELKKHNLYICEGHYFEWCNEQSICPHCNEKLTVTNLWDYYKKLECEDCKRFFEENYNQFLANSSTQ